MYIHSYKSLGHFPHEFGCQVDIMCTCVLVYMCTCVHVYLCTCVHVYLCTTVLTKCKYIFQVLDCTLYMYMYLHVCQSTYMYTCVLLKSGLKISTCPHVNWSRQPNIS